MFDKKFNVLVILFFVMMAAIPVAFSDTGNVANRLFPAPMPTPVDKPPYSAYKGVGIGTGLGISRYRAMPLSVATQISSPKSTTSFT